MKTFTIILLTGIISLSVSGGIAQELRFQERTRKLQMLQQQAQAVERRCQSSLHGIAAIICTNIGTEALFDQEELPDTDIIKIFDAQQLAVLQAYERHTITEAQRNVALDRIHVKTQQKLNASPGNAFSPLLETLPH